jgi:hypothetical protein
LARGEELARNIGGYGPLAIAWRISIQYLLLYRNDNTIQMGTNKHSKTNAWVVQAHENHNRDSLTFTPTKKKGKKEPGISD